MVKSHVTYTKEVKNNIDISGWLHMKYKNDGCKIIYFNGKSLKEEREELEQSQEYFNWQMDQISYKIGENLAKYIRQYDEIHGEGAYDIAYGLDPIYPNLDCENDDYGTDEDPDSDLETVDAILE